MKSPFLKASIVAAVAVLANTGVLFAEIEQDQPRMETAVKHLQEAKKADNSIPALERARGELQKASHNKHGWRLKAMHMVDEAIAKANEGDKQGVENKCNNAIAEIHTGMAKAR